MKRFYKVLVAVMLVANTLLLGGCSLFEKTPTAEELLTQTWVTDGHTYVDADVKMNLEAKMDMSELLGGGSDSASMLMAVDMYVKVKSDESIQHIEGSTGINVFDIDMSVPVRTYNSIVDGNVVTYTYDNDNEVWVTAEGEDVDSNIDVSGFADGIGVDIFENYEMQEVSKEDTIYTINGVINMANLMDSLGTDAENLLGDTLTTSEYDVSNIKLNVTIVFDRETLKPVSYVMSIDPSSMIIESGEITKFDIKMTINEIGTDKTVSIPQDIIDNAVSAEKINSESFEDIGLEEELFFEDLEE